jgi:hypothetical protein
MTLRDANNNHAGSDIARAADQPLPTDGFRSLRPRCAQLADFQDGGGDAGLSNSGVNAQDDEAAEAGVVDLLAGQILTFWGDSRWIRGTEQTVSLTVELPLQLYSIIHPSAGILTSARHGERWGS